GVWLVWLAGAGRFYRTPPIATVARAHSGTDFTVGQAMRTPQFWMLWLMLFVNVSAGIMIISQASPMAQQLAHMTPVAAAGMVGVVSMFNGAGRGLWAWASDAIGRARGYLRVYVIQAAIFFALPPLPSLTTVRPGL